MLASPNELSYFVELASTLNFSRASERIGISQPSLSAAIKRLEHAIGTELFIRGKNGVTLTQAGKRLLSHTKQLLQSWDTIRSETLASHYEIQGSFTLGCHQSVALYTLPNFLSALINEHPKLEIHLKHDLSRKILEGIVNLSIDIGIVVNPVRHPDIIIHKLYDDEVTFWHAGKLSEEPVVICDPDLTQSQQLLKRAHKSGLQYKRFLTSSSLEVIAQLTADGCGIGILPTRVAMTKQLQRADKMPAHHDEICLVYRHENRHIKAMQTMIAAIKQHVK